MIDPIAVVIPALLLAGWSCSNPSYAAGSQAAGQQQASVGASGEPTTWQTAQSGPEPREPDPEVIALIDKLAEISAEDNPFDDRFFADEAGSGIFGIFGIDSGPPGPPPDPTGPVRQLVRMGLKALPDLIDHLTDSRETGIVLGLGFSEGTGTVWESNKYDPRYRDPKRWPANVSRIGSLKRLDEREWKNAYCVGDFCYFAIGGIVNRQMFSAMTRGGGTVLDITSPVESSSLAEAVRTDWAGLSREAHIRSLVEDALTNIDSLTSASFPTESAVRRLMFYYPKEGEEFAIKLLGRFIYCDDAVSSLFERLLPEEGADGWRRVIDAFVREHGEPYAEVIRALLRTAVITDPGEYERQFIGDEALRVIAKVEKILAAIYPTYEREPYTAYFVNAVRLFDQGRLIEALKPFKSKKIDKAVHEAFKSNAPERFEGDNLDYYMDLFAIVCMSRSIGTEYDAQYRAYCERRIKEIEATDEKPEEDAMLAALKEWLKKLGKSGK